MLNVLFLLEKKPEDETKLALVYLPIPTLLRIQETTVFFKTPHRYTLGKYKKM